MSTNWNEALGSPSILETEYGPIRYRERGEGPTLLFLHGIIANSWLWRDVVPELAGDYRCISPDWPLGSHELGMNASTDFSLPGLASVVEAFLDELDLEDVTLIANDTGGAIAQWVAVHDPDRLARLVLTPCDAFENFLPLALRHLQLMGRTGPGMWLVGKTLHLPLIHRLPIAFGRLTVDPIDRDAMEHYTGPLRDNPETRADFTRLVRGISSRYTKEAAERIRSFEKPALVVWSSHDRIFPLRHGHELARRMPSAELVVISDAGAFIPEDQPRALAAEIRAFLESD